MSDNHLNSIELAVFSSRLSAICEEMGVVLQKTSFSPNIKDRLDYSCAFFDSTGAIIAQAAHIPVHLGSMAYAMKDIVASESWCEGDVLILNDPFKGGTHLPDVTVVMPAFCQDILVGFFACRAHHANIGCSQPGSMPLSSSLSEEGLIIEPSKLFKRRVIQSEVMKMISGLENCAGEDGLPGDFSAQVSAVRIGVKRLSDWIGAKDQSVDLFFDSAAQLNQYGEELAYAFLKELPVGSVYFEDFLDHDGFSQVPVRIALDLHVTRHNIILDFSKSSDQVSGNVNCPLSVCAASAYYVFACLLPDYIPHCDGVFSLLEIKAREGSVVNARSGAAVASGNVETSMRIVDVVMGALRKLGLNMPAAAQGTMNNVAMGNDDWDYYETIGGGMGASCLNKGLSAVQCHMTNSLNTPVESLELHYPVRLQRYAIRRNSGGIGALKGGDGIERSYVFKEPAQVTLLTDRREFEPWGLEGGLPGKMGENWLDGERITGKGVFKIGKGSCLTILTPGGGAYGAIE